MRKIIYLVLSIFLLLSFFNAPVNAQPISVKVIEEDPIIAIEVTMGSEALENATVRISGLQNETPLDGEYTTNNQGRVEFEEKAEDLYGVVNLRIEVQTDSSIKSIISTIVRGPNIEEAPIGKQLWTTLRKGAKRTKGKIQGNLTVKNSSLRYLVRESQRILADIMDSNIEKEGLGRRYATGAITLNEYFYEASNIEVRKSRLRGKLLFILRDIRLYSDSELEKVGVNPTSVEIHYNDLSEGRQLETSRRIRHLSQSF